MNAQARIKSSTLFAWTIGFKRNAQSTLPNVTRMVSVRLLRKWAAQKGLRLVHIIGRGSHIVTPEITSLSTLVRLQMNISTP